jgi:mRNA interferase HigB
MANRARSTGPADVKAEFGATVDFLADDKLVLDIAGNRYRPIVRVAYRFKRVLIKSVGTHAEYDRIGAETVP